MVKYSYKARNNDGQSVTGQLEAASSQEALVSLMNQQYTPISLEEMKESQSPGQVKGINFSFDLSVLNKRKINVKDVMVFCSNLSSMSSAGVPLLGALNTIAEQFQNPEMTKTLRKVAQLVSQGQAFSEALAMFPEVFSSFFVSMIRVGEMSGTLDNTLKALAIYLEKEEQLRQTVKSIMVYPTILMVVGTAVVIMILVFLMPQFVSIFTKANISLPIPTKILYAISLFLRQYWLGLIIFSVIVFAGIKISFHLQKGRNFWDRLFLKIPVLGDVIKKSMVARLCRNLGIMLTSGVSLLVALDMVRQVLDNVVFKEILQDVYESVERGDGLHKSLVTFHEIPKEVSYMISVGEQSGNLGTMLNKIADFYETKVQFEVKNLVTLIEPMFIVVLGIIVGVIMAAMILPLFDMVKTIENVRK